MDSRIYNSILKTVCYADVFDYPLTEGEVYRWITTPVILHQAEVETKNLIRQIKQANGVIYHKNRIMFLKGRGNLLNIRLKREEISVKKLSTAKRIASVIKYIPTIKLVGVSGSVAMENAAQEDDIDLFIITQAKTIWLSRLLATLFVELFGRRRRPGDLAVADKICLNMFVDEGYLSIPTKKQNIYLAHEVCQLKVLYDRDGTYQKFLIANKWVREFLPNVLVIKKFRKKEMEGKIRNNYSITQLLSILNMFAKKLQLWYMRKHHTTELISDTVLAFHPKDYTNDVLSAFEKRVKLYAS